MVLYLLVFMHVGSLILWPTSKAVKLNVCIWNVMHFQKTSFASLGLIPNRYMFFSGLFEDSLNLAKVGKLTGNKTADKNQGSN